MVVSCAAVAKSADICLVCYGFPPVKRGRVVFMLAFKLLIPTALFAALVLAAALQGLALSGHFPRTSTASAVGPVILFGSLLLTAGGFAAGTAAALHLIPWYAVVIGGGLAMLVAPLVLQLFSDRFVDGRGAPVAFAAASTLLAIMWIVLAIDVLR
jgi:hypothetical protein